MKEYSIEEAVKYLSQHSVYIDEWSGTGMWEVVEEVIRRNLSGKRITESWLKLKLEEAENR